MIDIISSSIRFGKILREHNELKVLYDFFSQIVDDRSNPWAFEYVKLISANLRRYGLHAFVIAEKIIEQNLESENDFVKRTSSEIKSYIAIKPNYSFILELSQKHEAILSDYIGQLICETIEYPKIKLENISLKLQQCSNELSTAILRSGVLNWLTDPTKIEILKKEMPFVEQYEAEISKHEHLHPYNKHNLAIINSLSGNQKKIAYYIENIKLVQFLSRCGILQGFFFELYDISESHIIKIKETHKNKSIHPVVIKSDLIYPSNHLFLFRYYHNGKTSYLLTKRITIQLSSTQAAMSTLVGYCYPTNEYSLLKIE